ncbi:hypothetical protein [Idiomarina abyssalis]|uniref:hypothetical protein n=1 Tax=Idiomarina abyssalis TaxID=86102 RepID=UPI001C93B865|nr:hypothetical protein [Idiomarina abyssalis]QZN92017.1 hypothetical protein K5X84_05825 [Idiomarina abyssalis]
MQKTKRRVGFLTKADNNKVNIAIQSNDFDDESYSELNQYFAFIHKLQPILTSYEAIELSFKELESLLIKYDNYFSTVQLFDAFQTDTLLTYLAETTQKTTNFLSSATSFLCCAEVRLQKEFGKNSKQLDEWNSYRKGLHHQSFAYRFLYEMRNYSQHFYLPIDSIKVELDNICIGGRSVKNTLSLKRDELLNSSYKWKENMVADIQKTEANIDLAPLIEEYMKSIRQIAQKYVVNYREEAERCSRYVASFKKQFQLPESCIPVIYIGETEEGQPVPRHMEFIPFPQFNWVYRHFLQLSGL